MPGEHLPGALELEHLLGRDVERPVDQGHLDEVAGPVRSRSSSAASRPMTACMPPIGSHGPRGTSGMSSYPVTHARPEVCSIVMANPARSRHGPSSPNAGIRTIIRPGPPAVQLVPGQAEAVGDAAA